MLETCAEQQGLPLRLCSRQRSKGDLCGAAHCNIFQKLKSDRIASPEVLGTVHKEVWSCPSCVHVRAGILYAFQSHAVNSAGLAQLALAPGHCNCE